MRILTSKSRLIQSRWSPLQLPNLALWLDAMDVSTITLNGSNVSQWNDKSGNARHVNQPTSASQPTYISNVVRFNGTTNHLFNSSPFIYAMPNNLVYFVIKTPTATPALARTLLGEVNSVNTNQIYAIGTPAGGDSRFVLTVIRNDANTSITDETTVRDVAPFNGDTNIIGLEDTATELRAYLNGISSNSLSYSRSGTLSLDRFGLCARSRSTPTAFFAVDISEVVISPVLTMLDRQRLEGYLAFKWGLRSALPNDHPYKNSHP